MLKQRIPSRIMSNTNNNLKTVASLFQQPWWLDAVAPGQWDAVTVEKGGQTVARMPYIKKKSYGFVVSVQPKLTQCLGPWLQPYKGKYTNQLSEEKKLMTELINQLPKFDLFSQSFHYSITNWLPFYWNGFQQKTLYTYVIEDLSDMDLVWQNIRKNTRRDISKAKEQVEVHTDLAIDSFFEINALTFKRQNKKVPYSRQMIERLDSACREHNCRKIFFAKDGQGKIHAAIYVVWDKNSAYYLMGGSDPELRNSGAMSLLLWEAIQFAATRTQKFDFEGSMRESIEQFVRGFGAYQKSYFCVSQTNSVLLKTGMDIRSSWGLLQKK